MEPDGHALLRCAVLSGHVGLLPALGTAAGHLASFVTKHKALKENAGGSEEKVWTLAQTVAMACLILVWLMRRDGRKTVQRSNVLQPAPKTHCRKTSCTTSFPCL